MKTELVMDCESFRSRNGFPARYSIGPISARLRVPVYPHTFMNAILFRCRLVHRNLYIFMDVIPTWRGLRIDEGFIQSYISCFMEYFEYM